MIRKSIVSLALALLLLPAAPSSAGGDDARVVHVVLVWLKEPGNAAHRARVMDATRGFSSIAGVEEIRVGEPVPSLRGSVDDSFDVGLYMVFSSQEALTAYLGNPQHQAAQASVLRPLVEKVIIYDFRDDGT